MTTRDYQFDNLKGILIFLVIFGHLIEYTIFKTSDSVSYIYSGIYLFHMPLFIFISGYFSKRINPNRIFELFITYTIWQMFYYPLFISLTTDESFFSALNPLFNPQTSYWYLLSIIIWKIVTPVLSKVKFILPISIIFGLLVGFSEVKSMTTFSFARSIAFYPFFLAGYLFTQSQLTNLRLRFNKIFGAISFSLLLIIGILFLNLMTPTLLEPHYLNKPLFFRDTYDTYLINPLNGIWIRAIIYALGFALTYTAFSFISSKKSLLSAIGQNTLFIYISHAMIVEFVRRTFLEQFDAFNGWMVLIIAFVSTLLYCLILSWRPISKLGRKLTTINSQLIYKKEKE